MGQARREVMLQRLRSLIVAPIIGLVMGAVFWLLGRRDRTTQLARDTAVQALDERRRMDAAVDKMDPTPAAARVWLESRARAKRDL